MSKDHWQERMPHPDSMAGGHRERKVPGAETYPVREEGEEDPEAGPLRKREEKEER